MVKPAVVTVIVTAALWPCVSAKAASHDPAAMPVTVNVTLGPFADGGVIVAIDEQVLVCEKASVSPVSCARIVAALLEPSPSTESVVGLTLKTPGGGAVGVGVGVFVGDGDGDTVGDAPGSGDAPGDGDAPGNDDAPGDGEVDGALVTVTPNEVVLPRVSLTEIVADPGPTAVTVNVPLPVARARRAVADALLDAAAATVATAVFEDVAVYEPV